METIEKIIEALESVDSLYEIYSDLARKGKDFDYSCHMARFHKQRKRDIIEHWDDNINQKG